VVFDRGLPDMMAYAALFSLDSKSFYRAADQNRYNPRAFFFDGWEEIYTNDSERKISFEGARIFGESVQLILTVRVFSRWFVRNGAKPAIHPRREAKQLQNPLLERAESRQMAIDLMHSLNHRQRHLLQRFQQSLRCRSSRFALALAGIKTRESFPCGRQ